MSTETGEIVKIHLDGDWSMSGVAAQFPSLAECFSGLMNSAAAAGQQKSLSDAVPEIDLAGVTNFDACGCQLLAFFVRTLRQNGFGAQVINIPDTFRSKIHFLGFDYELNLTL